MFRVNVNPSVNNLTVTKNRYTFLNSNIMTFTTLAIAFQPVEESERFFDVRERHDLSEDFAIRSVKHSGETVRGIVEPTGCDGGLDGVRVAAEVVVISLPLLQGSVNKDMFDSQDIVLLPFELKYKSVCRKSIRSETLKTDIVKSSTSRRTTLRLIPITRSSGHSSDE